MYAVVETSGHQYRITPGQTLQIDRLQAEIGDEITLDRVLMVSGEAVQIGAPTVEGATVSAKVVSHERGEKVITFKYKARKRYRKTRGFRADLTTIEITSINA